MNKLDNFCTEHSKSCKNINNCVSVSNKILTVSHLKENLLQLSIRNRNTTALVDTGASVSCISEDFCFQIFPSLYQNLANNPVIGEPKFKAIRGVCGETHPVRGTIELELNVNGFRVSQSFHIFSRLQNTVILGLDFLKANKAKIDLGDGSISFFEGAVHAPLIAKISDTQHAVMAYSVVLKPRSQTVISVKVPKTFDENLVLIDTTAGNHHSKYITAKCVTPVYGQYAQCMVLNPSNAPFHLKHDTMIGQVYDLDDSFDITNIDCDENVQSLSRVETDNNDFPQTQDLGDLPQDLNIDLSNSDLDEHQKQRLLQFIARNRKVFANNLSELGSTSVYKHKIETTDDIPVRSRHYRMSKEMKDLVENNTVHKSAVHHNRLKRYNSPENRQLPEESENMSKELNPLPPDEEVSNNSTNNATNSQQLLEINKIIRMKKKGNKQWYYVLWEDNDKTWELKANLPVKILQEFHIRITQTGHTRKKHVFKRKPNNIRKPPK